MWLSSEACCQIYDLHWICDNETSPGVVSDPIFEPPIDPVRKMRQSFNCQFHILSRKMWFFASNSKYRHIIYRWKPFFTTSINLRLLCQNKVPFGLDPPTKFVIFVRKSVPISRALSSWTEGTIVMKKPRETCWHPSWPSKLVRECLSTLELAASLYASIIHATELGFD